MNDLSFDQNPTNSQQLQWVEQCDDNFPAGADLEEVGTGKESIFFLHPFPEIHVYIEEIEPKSSAVYLFPSIRAARNAIQRSFLVEIVSYYMFSMTEACALP